MNGQLRRRGEGPLKITCAYGGVGLNSWETEEGGGEMEILLALVLAVVVNMCVYERKKGKHDVGRMRLRKKGPKH